jgi:hypothetical protein
MGWAGLLTHAMIRLVSNVLGRSKRSIPEVEATETPVSSGNGGEDATAPGSSIGEEADAIGGDELFCFPHFDVVQSPPDHHYLDNMEQVRHLLISVPIKKNLCSLFLCFFIYGPILFIGHWRWKKVDKKSAKGVENSW